MILSKKEEKEIQNEADKDNEKFLTKDEPFAYFKSWYDRMSEKTIKSVLSGISIDSCNYFEDMLNLNNKLKKNGFSKQQAAQIILSFDSSNIDEIGVLLHNEEDFNEFVRFAKTEPDKREVASKYLTLKTAGKSVFEGKIIEEEKPEYFDVVNEQNHVIGKATRNECHSYNLIHRDVYILVFNAQGKLFMKKRSYEKDLYKGMWEVSASGHVDSGENYETAAKRELSEELGIEKVVLKKISEFRNFNET